MDDPLLVAKLAKFGHRLTRLKANFDGLQAMVDAQGGVSPQLQDRITMLHTQLNALHELFPFVPVQSTVIAPLPGELGAVGN